MDSDSLIHSASKCLDSDSKGIFNMRFGKIIEHEAISEWKSKYLDYHRLKKVIKRLIEEGRGAVSRDLTVLKRLSEGEKGFLSFLTLEFTKIQEFYFSLIKDANSRKDVLRNQLAQLQRRENFDQLTQKSSTPVDHSTVSNSPDSPFPLKLKPALKTIVEKQIDETSQLSQKAPSSPSMGSLLRRESSSFLSFSSPILRLKSMSFNSKSSLELVEENQSNTSKAAVQINIYQYLTQSNLSFAKDQLKKFLLELYRSLQLIKSFRDLNITAYTKIVKKFEKNTNCQLKDSLMKELYGSKFFLSKDNEEITIEIEHLYKVHYCCGNITQAKKQLKMTAVASTALTLAAVSYITYPILCTGFFSGINMMLVVSILQSLTSSERPHSEKDGLALIYFGLGCPLIMSNLFGLNMYIWETFKINYRLICSFDPKMNSLRFSGLTAFLSTVYLVMVTMSLQGHYDAAIPYYAGQVWLTLSTVLIVLIGYCALFDPNSIVWTLGTLGKIVSAPYYSCKFKDFFLADQLVSILPFFQSVVYLLHITSYGNDSSVFKRINHNPNPFSTWYLILLSILPYYFRCVQCARRFHDNRKIEWINCCRYGLGMIVEALSMISAPSIYIFVFLHVIYSVFCLFWDINNDWGLGKGRLLMKWNRVHFKLTEPKSIASEEHSSAHQTHPKDVLVYPRWFYYFALITDSLGRFVWVPFLFMNIYSTVYVVTIIEMLRRCQWNLLRVEIEHVYNCQRYQVISETELPFSVDDLFDDPEADEQQQELPRTVEPEVTIRSSSQDSNDPYPLVTSSSSSTEKLSIINPSVLTSSNLTIVNGQSSSSGYDIEFGNGLIDLEED